MKLYYILILSMLVSLSCKNNETLFSTYNKSAYSLTYGDLNGEKEPNQPDSVTIKIEIEDVNSDSAYIFSHVKVGCRTFKTDKKVIKTKVQRSNYPIQIIIRSVGYFSIETQPILLDGKDVYLKAYLAEQDLFFDNCEGVFKDAQIRC